MFVCAMNAYGQTEKAVEPTAYTSGDWECVLEKGTLKLTKYNGSETEIEIPRTLEIPSGGVVPLFLMK